MQVKQLMTHYVKGIFPTETILNASRFMKELDIGILPVIDRSAQIIGILSDRDLVLRAIVDQLPPHTQIESIMTQPVYTIEETAEVGMALSLMAERQVRRLPVVDRNNKLVGILSLGDLAIAQLTDERAGLVLKEISEPTNNPNRDLKVDDFPL